MIKHVAFWVNWSGSRSPCIRLLMARSGIWRRSYPGIRQQDMQAQVLAIDEIVRYFNGTSEEGQIHDMPFGNVPLVSRTTAFEAEVTKLHERPPVKWCYSTGHEMAPLL